MLSFYKKYYKTAFDIALIALTVYLIMFLFSFLYRIATPIFLSLIIFWVIEPFAAFLNRKGVKKQIASAISIILLSALIIGAFVGAGMLFASQITTVVDNFPRYQDILQHQIEQKSNYLQKQLKNYPEVNDKLQDALDYLSAKAPGWIQDLLTKIVSLITSFSTFIFNVVLAAILAYFLSVDVKIWSKFVDKNTPRTFKNAFFFLKENVIKGILKYLSAQLKLISITFTSIFIALLVLGIKYSFSIALLSALFDLLPILGVPVIFIPWIIYLFIVGNNFLAICLSVLLVTVMLVRQILDPKITGNSLGVPSFVMLSCMIVSLSLFGVAGLILSPVLVILIKSLYEQGYLKRWIRLPEEEYDR